MSKKIGYEETIADVEQKILDSVPNATIPIVTGGTKVGHIKELGPDLLVEVTDVFCPKGDGVYNFGLSSGDGWSFHKKIPLGKPVLLPEVVVHHIEGTAERNYRRIQAESAMYGNKAAAEALNPGMRYVEGHDGAFLMREFRRYIVRRVSSEEMRMRG